MNKGKYTIRLHVQRVMRMLELGGHCPAGGYYRFDDTSPQIHTWDAGYNNDPCDVCQKFVGIGKYNCPCFAVEFRGDCGRAKEATLAAIGEYYKSRGRKW